jgi:hypothetical protein
MIVARSDRQLSRQGPDIGHVTENAKHVRLSSNSLLSTNSTHRSTYRQQWYPYMGLPKLYA